MMIENAPYMVAGETLVLLLDRSAANNATECRWRGKGISLGADTYGPLDEATIALFKSCRKAALADRDRVQIEDGRVRVRAARVFQLEAA
jgi:hypothetical protein